MNELATKPVAAKDMTSPDDLQVRLRMRPDLEATAVRADGEDGWTVKDPLSLRYFRLRNPEYALLKLLDGSATIGSLIRTCERKFPGENLTVESLQLFLSMLSESGLAVSDRPGSGQRFIQRAEREKTSRRVASVTGILAIRFRGMDPKRLLNALRPFASLVATPVVLAGLGLLAMTGLLLAILQFDQLLLRLPALQTLAGPHNMLSLLIAIVLIKMLHELGHALTCRQLGGECHELGFMLLVFMPVLYCDVTDAWMLSRRRSRIAISAAGIAVEIVLAATCMLLWWISVPGWLNSFFLNVMLVCSVNTVLLNGNPLLRYDGYHVLADQVNIPNLGGQSRQVVHSLLERLVLGISTPDDELRLDARAWFLVTYGIASAVYRLFVIFAILWFLHELFASWHLEVVSDLLALPVIAGALLIPVVRLVMRTRSALKSHPEDRRRSLLGIAGVLTATIALSLVPFPLEVAAPFVTTPADASAVFVTAPGRVEMAIPAGSPISRGEPVGRLVNESLELDRDRLIAEVDERTLHLKNLEARRGSDPATRFQLPAARIALKSAQERLGRNAREYQRLKLTSPVDGIVLAPPNIPDAPAGDTAPRYWTGTPLDPQNRNAFLEERTLFCYVGNPSELEATLIVEQNSIDFLEVGQPVELQFQSAPGATRTGQVTEIAQTDAASIPREIVAAGLAPTDPKSGELRPDDVSYEVRVRLDGPDAPVALYSPGRARVSCDWRSAASRAARYIRQTFAAF
jgi:putative peptide zinc metalloprotease protein